LYKPVKALNELLVLDIKLFLVCVPKQFDEMVAIGLYYTHLHDCNCVEIRFWSK